MSESRRDEELQELMALDAVGALDDDERGELEAAIADRPDLQRELEELRAAAAAMADAVSEVLPATLRASVLDAIDGVEQLPTVAPVVSISAARRRRRWVAVGAAAAAVVAIVAGVLVISPFDGSDTDEIAAVIDAPDAVTIDMPATADGDFSGRISLVYSQREDAVVLQGAGLETPPEDGVYQLWAIRDGTPEPDVTFRPDDGDVELYVPGFDPASAEAWAVTREPTPEGSLTPTLPILAITA